MEGCGADLGGGVGGEHPIQLEVNSVGSASRVGAGDVEVLHSLAATVFVGGKVKVLAL